MLLADAAQHAHDAAVMELVEELEAAAAPSPNDALVELAGLHTATRLTQLTYKCDAGRVVVSEYVALKNQRDDAADVCRICHGPGTVRPADVDDETGERLLRDTCLCRGSIGCVHEECLVRWYESVDFPVEPRCQTCRGQFRNEGGLVLSRRLVAHRRSQAAKRTTPETPTDLARRAADTGERRGVRQLAVFFGGFARDDNL